MPKGFAIYRIRESMLQVFVDPVLDPESIDFLGVKTKAGKSIRGTNPGDPGDQFQFRQSRQLNEQIARIIDVEL